MQRCLLNVWFGATVLMLIVSSPIFAQKPTPAVQAQVVKLANEGVAKQNKGDYNGAVASYTKALQLSPQDLQILLFRARVNAFALNNARAAIEDATKIIALAPKSAEVYFLRGISYLNSQRLVEAEKDLEQALKYGPLDENLCRSLAITYSVQQKYERALEILTKGIKLFPKQAFLYYERANNLSNVGRCDQAISDYNVSIKLDSTNINAYLNRANCRGQIKDFLGSVKDYTQLIAKDPKNIMFWYNRGNAFEELKQYDSALEDLNQVLVLDSTRHRARTLKAKIYLQQGDYVRAENECTQLLRMNSQDAAGFANAGNIVSAYLQRESFINAGAYGIRANARYSQGNLQGACADARKASYLGVPTTSALNLCKDQAFIPDLNVPQSYQLYPRNATDSALITIKGVMRLTGYDSVYAVLRKNGSPIKRIASALHYMKMTVQSISSTASMQSFVEFALPIHAELSQYSITLSVRDAKRDTVVFERDSIVCGDVLLMSGQSNAVLGEVPKERNPYLRTFVVGAADAYWGTASAKSNDDYNVGALGYELISRISTELKIPVALINGGLSGSTIEQHFRDNTNPINSMSWYGRMLWRVREAGLVNAAKAMVWYQGESNENAGYGDKFTTLHTAWKQDYLNIKKTYVVQIRPSECNQSPITSPREEQRLLGSRLGTVEVIAASGLPAHDGCHYGNDGYITLGKQLFNLINRDFYKATDTLGISSPNLTKAVWTNAKRDEIALTFASNDALVCGSDTSVAGKVRTLANEAFLLDGKPAKAVSVRSEKNVVLVKLSSASGAKTISYIPEKCYVASGDVPCVVYEGPWITTSRGVGALTFANVTIQAIP
jgi:tetratricopeptide (TPR) repeat protein